VRRRIKWWGIWGGNVVRKATIIIIILIKEFNVKGERA
jgi:hypothetical protein